MDEITAWHEAGHAVVAVILGGEVEHVSIEVSDTDYAGATVVNWGLAMDRRAREINDIRVAFAGPIAEMIFVGDYEYLRIKQEHAADWAIIADATGRLGIDVCSEQRLLPTIASALYERLRCEQIWSAVGDVAEQLEIEGTIDGDTVNDLVGFWLRQQ